jgi:hypothetical protein
MSLLLNFEWEEAPGRKTLSNPSPAPPAADFQDAPAKQTARQSAFSRNLIRMAEPTRSKVLPIAFHNNRRVRKADGLWLHKDRRARRVYRTSI